MPIVKNENKTENKVEFIGKAWINKVEKEGSKYDGTEFIQISLNRDIEKLEVGQNEKIQLWPNKKRENKENDPDYTVSLRNK